MRSFYRSVEVEDGLLIAENVTYMRGRNGIDSKRRADLAHDVPDEAGGSRSGRAGAVLLALHAHCPHGEGATLQGMFHALSRYGRVLGVQPRRNRALAVVRVLDSDQRQKPRGPTGVALDRDEIDDIAHGLKCR
jgi:hypothetical protein